MTKDAFDYEVMMKIFEVLNSDEDDKIRRMFDELSRLWGPFNRINNLVFFPSIILISAKSTKSVSYLRNELKK